MTEWANYDAHGKRVPPSSNRAGPGSNHGARLEGGGGW